VYPVPELKEIYRSFADRYQALVGREDYEGNLLPAILAVDALAGRDVIELGAGTGRVSCLIASIAQRLVAADISHHMLTYGKRRLEELQLSNWHVSLESHRWLPFADGTADVIIAGWSFCYAALDAGEGWQPALEQALAQVERVLRPGGVLVLIESLGTGFESPNRPEVLVDYLAYLDTHGFDSAWVRTDYCFVDTAEAKDLTSFFFGDAPMPMWETASGVIVPECTGLWWKTFK
jgi:ubiquinone/menaquinone biosynthesis C-methylase UbiE